MTYGLGVDLGTTFTAAAVQRDGRVEMVGLGVRSLELPTVVFLRADDGALLVGEAAERRGAAEPAALAREFKRRLGDPAPILLAGRPTSPQALLARVLRHVVDEVTSRQGGPPAAVVLTHPANWGPFKLDLLRQAVRLAEVDDGGGVAVTFVPEPVAAAVHHSAGTRVAPGERVAVYDFGGGTFDAAVLHRTDDGFEVLGTPEGIEHLGGIDVDEAVLGLVVQAVGADVLAAVDADDPLGRAALARLRRDCVDAKETLSVDFEATVPVTLPGVSTSVRVTRAELEQLIRPALADTVAALRRALRSAGVEPADLRAVLLVGGSSRIPFVAELVQQELGVPVALESHPKHAVALGAARMAEVPAEAGAVAPTPAAPASASAEADALALVVPVAPPVEPVEPVAAAEGAPVPAAAPAPVELEPVPEASGRSAGPWWRRWRTWPRRPVLAGAGVAAVVAVALGVAATSGGSDTPDAPGAPGSSSTVAASSTSTTLPRTPTTFLSTTTVPPPPSTPPPPPPSTPPPAPDTTAAPPPVTTAAPPPATTARRRTSPPATAAPAPAPQPEPTAPPAPETTAAPDPPPPEPPTTPPPVTQLNPTTSTIALN